MGMSGKNTMELIIAARDRTSGAFTKINSRVGGLESVAKKASAALAKTAKAGALIGGAAVVAGLAASTKMFMDFEDAMANVRKTTGFTKDQIDVLGTAINAMALRIPVAQTELAGIAAVAGQLGITGQKNILGFTETAAKMSTAFDMSAESVAIAAAKLSNIYDIPIKQVSNLGSAINALGNTTAASEPQILNFSMALGASAKMLGFGATESVAMGASLVSMGMDASAAGTRLNSAFTQMGKNVDKVSELLGISEEEFKAGFGEDPMNMLTRIIAKLGEIKDPLDRNTVAAETFGLIGAKAIVNLGANLEGLNTNLKTSATAFEENTSLTEEFAAKTDTLKARFQLLKNSISGLLIDIGGEMAPTLNTIIDGVRNIIPLLKDLIFGITAGFGEMFESITRQAGPALDPLIEKVAEAGNKISKGLNFKTLLDDIGVLIGAGLNPLISGFTWLIDKLGPLWDLIGKGATLFHNLANALKTEEGRMDDIIDATETLTKSKQDLFNVNEKLRGNVETLAEVLDKAGGWTIALSDLEADAKTKTDALAVARLKATEAITAHGASSEIAKTAIENVKIAEDAATVATNTFNTSLETATQHVIDSGVATEGLEKAQLDFTTSTEEAAIKQRELIIAITDVETELEEAKAAPFNLGVAFDDFGKLVTRVFLAIPLKVAEGILSVQETISGGLEKIGLGGLGEKLESDTEHIKERIASLCESLETNIENPLLEDIPKASKAMEEAVSNSLTAIATPAKRAKEVVEDIDTALTDTGKTAKDTGEEGEEAFKKVGVTVDEATGKVEILTDNLGDTADSFKDNSKVAETLLELDWDIFSQLKADLPDIDKGIGDMTDAFTGLEDVLESNIENLEKVKASVENISGISSPFTEDGFMNGIKSIGSFANTLKDAGSAINTFSSLQEISLDGMVNFSLHVNDMVSALRILDNQMEDLVPSFGEMDSLITDIADAFLYGDDKVDIFVSDFESAIGAAKDLLYAEADVMNEFDAIVDKALAAGEMTYLKTYVEEGGMYGQEWKTITVDSVMDVRRAVQTNLNHMGDDFQTTEHIITSGAKSMQRDIWKSVYSLDQWAKSTYGVSLSSAELHEVLRKPPEEQKKWLDNIMHSETALTFQMDKQTNALANQTKQLEKITDALEPYLNFMQTLNDLAKLSTLSTADLNSGLDAIKDTLVNLSSALETFDLEPAMKSLFGDEGAAEGFLLTTEKYESKFTSMITYIDRMAISLVTLMDAFKSLSEINESVLADQSALEDVFKGIVTGMTNVDVLMSKGFANEIVKGLEGMLKSAQPLIMYFRTNNAAVEEFNKTLTTFKNTLLNVVNVMDALKTISETTSMGVEEMSASFDTASKFIREFNSALMSHVSAREGEWDINKYYDDIFGNIKNFAKDWEKLTSDMKGSFETFETASSTIATMLNGVLTLSSAFVALGRASIASSTDMDRAMQNSIVFVERFTESLRTNLKTIVDVLFDLSFEWAKHSKMMDIVMPSYSSATSNVGTLIGSLTSLSSALKSLSATGTISTTEFNRGFESLVGSITHFATSFKANAPALIESLRLLKNAYEENEAVLVPLMQDFVIITKSFASVAINANIMIRAFKELGENSGSLEEGFKTLITFIKDVVENTKEFYTPEAAAELVRFIDDINKVIASFADLDDKIATAVSGIQNKITDAVEGIERSLLSLEELNKTMFESGANLIGSFIDGIISMQTALELALIDVANTIEDYLGVASPTELGALKDVDAWPRNLVQSFSKGIEAEMGGLNASLGTMIAPATVMSEGGGSGNRTSFVFNITQNIKDKETADYSTQELDRMIRKHVV